MGDAVLSLSYSAPHFAADATVERFDVICRGANGGYVPATTANLAAAGGLISGVALTPASDSAPIQFQPIGQGIVNGALGAGTASLVSVTALGKLVRGTSGPGGIIGKCNTAGDLYPLTPVDVSAQLLTAGSEVNIQSFGAVCNGTTDDRTAVNAALDWVGATGRIRIPGPTKLGGGNITTPLGVTLVFSPGARLIVGAGRTLTIGGPIEAPEEQHIFELENLSTSIIARGSGNSSRYYIRWFGAKGDNSTDDTTALKSFLTLTGDLYVSPGTYKISSQCTIQNNTRLFGAGPQSTIRQTGMTVNAGNLIGKYVLFESVFSADDEIKRNIEICYVRFLGDNTPFFQTALIDQIDCHTIRIRNGTDVNVHHCSFEHIYANPVRSDGGGRRFHFTDNHCYECAGEPNWNARDSINARNIIDTCWAIECAQQNVRIIDNILRNCDTGISIGGDGGYEPYLREDIGYTITGATNASPIVITAVGHGFTAPGQAVNITGVTGNTAANGRYYVGAVLSADTFTLVNAGGLPIAGNGAYAGGGTIFFYGDFGCHVEGNLIDGTRSGSGIQIGEPVVGCIVKGNTVRRTAQVGIIVNGSSFFASNARACVIEGNVVESTGSHGIYISNGDSHQILNNVVLRAPTPWPSPAYDTRYGILLQNSGTDMKNLVVRGNRVSSGLAPFLINGLIDCTFEDNIGQVEIQNGQGETTFRSFKNNVGGVNILSGSPTFGDQYTGGKTAGVSITKAAEPRITTRKLTVSYTAFRDTGGGAGAATITLARLPVGTKVCNVIARTTVAYAGPAGTIALEVGYGGTANAYMLTHDVKTAAITRGTVDGDLGAELARASTVQGGGLASFSTQRDVQATLTLGAGACSQLTTGTTEIYLTTEQILDYVQPP